MQVGLSLREARLNSGLDLYEVHRVTKISVESLRAMEEDRWEEVPEPDEQLATYARFLGLEGLPPPGEPRRHEALTGWPPRGVLLVIGFAALVGLIIGLVAVGPLGGNGGEGGTEATNAGPAVQTTTSTTASAPVSVELRTNALVWVCLVDQHGRPVINGLNLVRDQTVGPYDGKAFDMTFGNGKIELTVNGQTVNVPPIAAPLGYRITPDGATRLDPSDGPTCI